MRQAGDDVLIDGPGGDSILLKHVKLAALDAGDFLSNAAQSLFEALKRPIALF